jgi:hypothetical protein
MRLHRLARDTFVIRMQPKSNTKDENRRFHVPASNELKRKIELFTFNVPSVGQVGNVAHTIYPQVDCGDNWRSNAALEMPPEPVAECCHLVRRKIDLSTRNQLTADHWPWFQLFQTVRPQPYVS